MPENNQDSDRDFEVAIIGMSLRVPGAEGIEEFWKNLIDGRNSIVSLPKTASPPTGVRPESFVPYSADLPKIEMFDAEFFGYSDREAEMMDPQQRLFLQEAWKALDHSGYNTGKPTSSIGVFACAAMNEYYPRHVYPTLDRLDPTSRYLSMMGNDKDFLATKVSYKLNLRGPSMTVQTACSSSLVAVHMAAQSLLSSECDIALAGGVSLVIPQQTGYIHQEGMITSADGRCRSFDASASGTVFGSGLGIVVLKRLNTAMDDRDHIHAIIRGSAVNNDGSAKVGYTAPGVEGQTALISEALEIAGVEAETIAMLEAHGTATAVGDPIEVESLTRAFSTNRRNYCALGSVKSNIGHLDAASGVVGLIKATLALERKMIPPTLHCENPNPALKLEQSPFYLNSRLREWPEDGGVPRRAGVSSFGLGGTNAHVVLEEAPQLQSRPSASEGPFLVPLSARSTNALNSMRKNLAAFLAQNPTSDLADIAFTLQEGRHQFEERCIFVVHEVSELKEQLLSFDDEETADLESHSADLKSVGAKWLAGERVDWSKLRTDPFVKRIPLPSYPFEDKRFWLDRPTESESAKPTDCEGLFYQLKWLKFEKDCNAVTELLDRQWLILSADDFGQIVSKYLIAEGAPCRVIDPEALCGNDLLQGIDPGRPLSILHVCPIEDSVGGSIVRNRDCLLGLFRLLEDQEPSLPLKIWLITRGAISAEEGDATSKGLGQSPVWGIGRSLMLEHPEWAGGLIDLCPKEKSPENAEFLIDAIRQCRREDQLALRSGRILVPRLTRFEMSSSKPGKTLNAEGSYLVTGGMGSLGMAAAEVLADKGARKIILVGRTKSPDLERITRIEEKGTIVSLVVADVSKPDEFGAVLQELGSSACPVHGIVHAAGVLENRRVTQIDTADFDRDTLAKIAGARTLHNWSLKQPLDFFISFSSLGSVLGAPEHGAYDAGNQFLDSLAHYRRSIGLPATSMNWGVVKNGLSAGRDLSTLAANGMRTLSIERAKQAFAEALLNADLAQLIVADIDWEKFAATYCAKRARPIISAFMPAKILSKIKPATLTLNRRTSRRLVQKVVSQVTGAADDQSVPLDLGFVDLGLDSLMAIDLRSRLQQESSCQLPVTLAFDYPNIAQLADFLCRAVSEQAKETQGDANHGEKNLTKESKK